MPETKYEVAECTVGACQAWFEVLQDLGFGKERAAAQAAPEQEGPVDTAAEAEKVKQAQGGEGPVKIKITLGGLVSKLHNEGLLPRAAAIVTTASEDEVDDVPLDLVEEGIFHFTQRSVELWKSLLGIESGMASNFQAGAGSGSTSKT